MGLFLLMFGPSLVIAFGISIGYQGNLFRWERALLAATVIGGILGIVILWFWNKKVGIAEVNVPGFWDTFKLWLIGCVLLIPIPILAGWWGSGFCWNWRDISRKQKIGFSASVSLIILLWVVALQNASEGALLLTIGIFFGVMIFILFPREGNYAKKDKIDYLAGRDNLDTIQRTMGSSKQGETSGVWCGKTTAVAKNDNDESQGDDIHISMDDRAVVIGPPGTGKTAFLISINKV